MPSIRIELDVTREDANKFHARVSRGESFPIEKQAVLDEVWARGHTPTGNVSYRGISNGQPPRLKFDAGVSLT